MPANLRNILRPPALWLSMFVLCAGFALLARGAAGSDQANLLPASDSRFRYEGRFDFADPAAPVVIWQASRIAVDFDGTTLGLRFANASDQCFFNAVIDGRSTMVELRNGKQPVGVSFSGLGAGRHSLVLFKRSEATAGTVRFLGIELAPGARAWAPPRPVYRLAMEFIGDSITAGACDEDGPADQWDNRATHNNALSYGALTSAAFSADYLNIAVSGIGIASGYVSVLMGQVWDRIYPDAQSPRADLARWTPAVVFINLGENDDSFTRGHKEPFPPGFADGYVALVQAIRRAHPGARIVLLRGGMFGGSQSEPLINAWQSAVSRLETGDPRISHFVFQHWTGNHPRVADHRAMADELIAWLRSQDFMKSHL
jgi:lysophospholipase L1-like esterase